MPRIASTVPSFSTRDLDLGVHFTGMADRGEVLAPVLDPLDRVSVLTRRESDEKILRIEFAAGAETAADIELDIVDGRLRQPHHAGHGAAIEKRQFCRAGDREMILPGVPLRKQASRFHRQRGVPLHAEAFASDIRRLGESRIGIAALRRESRGDIATGPREQQMRAGCGGLRVNAGCKRIDFDDDFTGGVFGKLGAVRQHDGNRFTNIADIFIGDHRLGVRRDGRVLAPKRDRRDRLRDVERDDDRADAGHRQGRRRINLDDTAERRGAAHDRRVPLSVALDVVDILAAPAQEAPVFDPLDRPSDIGVDGSHPAFGLCFLA